MSKSRKRSASRRNRFVGFADEISKTIDPATYPALVERSQEEPSRKLQEPGFERFGTMLEVPDGKVAFAQWRNLSHRVPSYASLKTLRLFHGNEPRDS